MKNMSVGKKILFGFLIVTAMIAIILGMTVVTSLSRNRDLDRVNSMSTLQRDANLLMDNFNLARVEIRSLFTSIEAEAEYNLALEYLDKCSVLLEEMEQMSAVLDNYLMDDIGVLREGFDSVRNAVVTVGSNDEQALAALAIMQENEQSMSDKSEILFDAVSKMALDIGGEDPVAGLERITTVISPAKDLGDEVDKLRMLSRRLSLVQDATSIQELYAGLDIIQQQAASIRGTLVSQEAIASIDDVSGSLDGFRSAVDEVGVILAKSDTEIAIARDVFLELNTKVNNFVETISNDSASLTQMAINTSQITMMIMVVISVIAVIFSVLIATVIGRSITRPLNKMKSVMLQAGETGNLAFSDEMRQDIQKEAAAKNEIGQSLHAFTRFVDHVTRVADILQQVAEKDLAVNINLLSDEDTMGHSLQTMLDNLNQMFAEINSIASQVATSSNEIATGAQALAQGSTEQASTVEEISAAVNGINEQMNTSTATVNEAAQGSVEMSTVASDGNKKMSQMMDSMQEINEASQAIGQVIKVIDDIAFQTNILALNAAVEAARAGEHGKGFAVVADEVRNLAGKSADAAKKTSDLISSNIEKTEQGLTYTQDTANSLTQIMDGIQQTSAALQTVAEQSEGAKVSTAQVTQAIDQVALVVQQNSATSEESAAASEEMSSQAQVLQQLIAQFHLRDMNQSYTPALPESSAAGKDLPDIDSSQPTIF